MCASESRCICTVFELSTGRSRIISSKTYGSGRAEAASEDYLRNMAAVEHDGAREEADTEIEEALKVVEAAEEKARAQRRAEIACAVAFARAKAVAEKEQKAVDAAAHKSKRTTKKGKKKKRRGATQKVSCPR